jgi:hypothetical protein
MYYIIKRAEESAKLRRKKAKNKKAVPVKVLGF